MTKTRNQSRKASIALQDGISAQRIWRNRDKAYRTERRLVSTQSNKYLASAIFRDGQPDPPPGYVFVPFGTLKLSRICMEIAKAQNITTYYVAEVKTVQISDLARYSHHVGYYLSRRIVREACRLFGYVAFQGRLIKAADVHAEQAKIELAERIRHSAVSPSASSKPTMIPHRAETWQEVSDMFKEIYPNMPESSIQEIANHAWEKNTARIGIVADLPLHMRVQLATVAHIRHTYTDYDRLLAAFNDRNEARRTVEQAIVDILVKWGPSWIRGGKEMTQTYRDIVILDEENLQSQDVQGTIENGIRISSDEDDDGDDRDTDDSGRNDPSRGGSDSSGTGDHVANPIAISDDEGGSNNLNSHRFTNDASGSLEYRAFPDNSYASQRAGMAVSPNTLAYDPSLSRTVIRDEFHRLPNDIPVPPDKEYPRQVAAPYQGRLWPTSSLPNEPNLIYSDQRHAGTGESRGPVYTARDPTYPPPYGRDSHERLRPPYNSHAPAQVHEWPMQAREHHVSRSYGQAPPPGLSPPSRPIDYSYPAQIADSSRWPTQAPATFSHRQPSTRPFASYPETYVHGAHASVHHVSLAETSPRNERTAYSNRLPYPEDYTGYTHGHVSTSYHANLGLAPPMQFYRQER